MELLLLFCLLLIVNYLEVEVLRPCQAVVVAAAVVAVAASISSLARVPGPMILKNNNLEVIILMCVD